MNISKLTNMRVRLMQTVTGAYEITLNKNKEKLSKIILDKSNRVMQSDLARRMRVAKGFFTLEISPPSSYELRPLAIGSYLLVHDIFKASYICLGLILTLQEDITLVKEFIQHKCYKYLTVKQALLLFLVCTEVGLWFFMGETIGKMHFVGYKV